VLSGGQENPGAIQTETVFHILVDILFQDVGPRFDFYDDGGLVIFKKNDIETLVVEIHVPQQIPADCLKEGHDDFTFDVFFVALTAGDDMGFDVDGF
jgi:hypothetical protein